MSDLEAARRALFEDPSDEERWAVYGDCLHAAGDPRGEIIAMELRGEQHPKEMEYFEQAVAEDLRNAWRLNWRYGHIWTASAGWREDEDGYELLAQLLRLDVATFLEGLVIHDHHLAAHFAQSLEVLVERERPALHRIELVQTGPPSYVRDTDVDVLLSAQTLPRLGWLHLGVRFAETNENVWERIKRSPLVRREGFIITGSPLAPAVCHGCRNENPARIFVLDDEGIPHAEPGHELTYTYRAFYACDCGVTFASEVDHDCFDYEDIWTVYHYYWIDGRGSRDLRSYMQSCRRPLDPVCQCPVHTQLRASLSTIRIDAAARTRGRGGAHQMRLEVRGGLPQLVAC